MAHKYVGVVVIHCHLLNHEDEGMMMVAQIVQEGIVQWKFYKSSVYL